MRIRSLALASFLALELSPLASHAIDLDSEGKIKVTGFYQLTGGKVLSGSALGQSNWSYMKWNCPCAIQAWEYVGVYEKSKGFQFDQESLLGAQINAEITPSLTATAQLVLRPKNYEDGNGKPTLDWAYASWKATDNLSLQAGRKRIPLYYYSDYLYIGYAYPWVRPAPDVYGWPIFTYDGLTAQYTHDLGGEWTVNATAWAGSFESKKNAYDTLIYYGSETQEKWKKIKGISASVSNGTIEARAMMMTHRQDTWQVDPATKAQTFFNDNVFTRIVALSLNVDYQNWLLRTELNRFSQRPSEPTKFVYDYYLVGVGYKWGEFTPMITQSHYITAPNTLVPQEGRKTRALSLRWDFRQNMALKFQYDQSTDESKYSYPFFGDHKLFSVSLQGVF